MQVVGCPNGKGERGSAAGIYMYLPPSNNTPDLYFCKIYVPTSLKQYSQLVCTYFSKTCIYICTKLASLEQYSNFYTFYKNMYIFLPPWNNTPNSYTLYKIYLYVLLFLPKVCSRHIHVCVLTGIILTTCTMCT